MWNVNYIIKYQKDIKGRIDTMKTVAYLRVSSKDQNLDRQLVEIKKSGIEDKYIY